MGCEGIYLRDWTLENELDIPQWNGCSWIRKIGRQRWGVTEWMFDIMRMLPKGCWRLDSAERTSEIGQYRMAWMIQVAYQRMDNCLWTLEFWHKGLDITGFVSDRALQNGLDIIEFVTYQTLKDGGYSMDVRDRMLQDWRWRMLFVLRLLQIPNGSDVRLFKVGRHRLDVTECTLKFH